MVLLQVKETTVKISETFVKGNILLDKTEHDK